MNTQLTNKEIKEILYSRILKSVYKPARYSGGEPGAIEPKENAAVSFAFCFPDSYEVGMSHLGMKIMYALLNELYDVRCERCFAPMSDMAQALRENGVPLYSLESYSPLRSFDFVGFSIQYEMSLTNVLYMLELADIPFLASEREGKDYPVLIAGGPCTVNPEPFADIFDVIVIGEGELVTPKIINAYKNNKNREAFLSEICNYEGVYVPAFYSVDENGVRTASHCAPERVRRTYITDMDASFFPKETIVPFVEPVHDRVMIEVMRGCPRGCRFCQAGFIYRPVRQKSLATVKEQTRSQLASSGYEEISFSSLSTTDYRYCAEALNYVLEEYDGNAVSVSLPSLRIDEFSMKLVNEMNKGRKISLTFAPEAGSQRMRDVINKNVDENDIFTTLESAFKSGFTKIKLYFMMGLPYETDEDIKAIGELTNRIVDLYFRLGGKIKNLTLSASVACYVPKPHTPFEFFPQNTREQFEHKQKLLVASMNRRVKLSYSDPFLASLEAAFARGGRELCQVLINAYRGGCSFDSWADCCNTGAWEAAFAEAGLSVSELAQREYAYDEAMPWDFVDVGVKKEFFVREAQRAGEAKTTKNCYEACSSCGIKEEGGKCDFEI